MFLAHTLRRGASLLETAIASLAWLSPLINPPTVFAVGVATPLLIVLFLALVVRREARARGRALGPAVFVPV